MPWLSLSDIKDLATILGVGVGALTLVKGLAEYGRSALLARVERFSKLKEQFLNDTVLAKIAELLETDDIRLREVPAREKWQFLFFFEEIALLVRAGLMTDELACYNFGYYALRCERSQYFWTIAFPKDETYWPLFLAFVKRMEAVEAVKKINRAKFVAAIRA
jgi:hypothetical protein